MALGSVAAPQAVADPDPCDGSPRAFFDDVTDDSHVAAAVDCLVWHSIVAGTTHEVFAPGDAVRRGQLATLLDSSVTRIAGELADPPEPRFADTGGVHGPAAERLGHAGIVDGRTTDRFAPDDPVRRDELASVVVNTYRYLAGADAGNGRHGFTDVAGNTHEEAIVTGVTLGLVTGRTETTYEPSTATTRSQVALVVRRLLSLAVQDPSIAASLAPPDGYAVRVGPLPSSLVEQMHGVTWREGCPVGPGELRLVAVVTTDFGGVDRWGLMVVHHDVADDVATAFGSLYDAGFPIARLEPIVRFGGDDDASMAANNTSAFNCRRVTGGSAWSEHAYGRAIDINPVQNPYVRGEVVLPEAGRAYLDRDDVRDGMLVRPGPVTAFDDVDWGWGGDFESLKDYQHVSSSGR